MRPDAVEMVDVPVIDLEEDVCPAVVLEDVPWEVYLGLRDIEENNHVRMTYLDGTLILMSPEYIHEDGTANLEVLIRNAAVGFEIDIKSARSATFGKKGKGGSKGSAKEPDSSFWIGSSERAMRGKKEIIRPPDLALEVDNKADSVIALPIYARLGVQEVWRYRVRKGKLWFGRLSGKTYETVDRSVCFPKLTPELVLKALSVFNAGTMSETSWAVWLMDWARQLPEPPDHD